MHLNLFQTAEEDKIDIYYKEMTPTIEKIISLIRKDRPELYGICENGERTLLDLESIFYFDTVDRRTFAYTETDTYQVTSAIGQLEEELEPFGFTRINKANIVNIYHIQKIKPEPNMRITVLLRNGEHLQINRSYKRNFQDYLTKFRKTI